MLKHITKVINNEADFVDDGVSSGDSSSSESGDEGSSIDEDIDTEVTAESEEVIDDLEVLSALKGLSEEEAKKFIKDLETPEEDLTKPENAALIKCRVCPEAMIKNVSARQRHFLGRKHLKKVNRVLHLHSQPEDQIAKAKITKSISGAAHRRKVAANKAKKVTPKKEIAKSADKPAAKENSFKKETSKSVDKPATEMKASKKEAVNSTDKPVTEKKASKKDTAKSADKPATEKKSSKKASKAAATSEPIEEKSPAKVNKSNNKKRKAPVEEAAKEEVIEVKEADESPAPKSKKSKPAKKSAATKNKKANK